MLKSIANKSGNNYEQVWIVMDKDDFPPENFNRALDLAKQDDMRVAYSNQAFELWFLLHFSFVNTGMSRVAYRQKLTELLGRDYKKTMLECTTCWKINRGTR